MVWDVFVSHATEDKNAIAAPLVSSLLELGLSVWFDELVLAPGARLRESIDEGLAQCRFAIVVLSRSYITKNWTRYEFDGLIQRFAARQLTILPIWHDLTREDVARFSLTLADVVGLPSSLGPRTIATRLATVMQAKPDSRSQADATTVAQGNGLQVFRTKFAYGSDAELRCAELLQKFARKNRKFSFFQVPAQQTHESGRGGHRTSACGLESPPGITYMRIIFRDEWYTYSDDSEDYSLPSLLLINSNKPVLNRLVEEIARIASIDK